jgi:hypothetical protein
LDPVERFVFLGFTYFQLIFSFDNSTAVYKDLRPYIYPGEDSNP